MLISLKGDRRVKFIRRKLTMFRYDPGGHSMKPPNSNALDYQYFKNSISFHNT